MKRFLVLFFCGLAATSFAQSALTIYNQNFAVVRDSLRLEFKQGINELRYPGATAQLEPDSVVLRDPTGKFSFQILEQSFRNDPVTQQYLLSLFEGKTIDFEHNTTEKGEPKKEIIRGKIIRSGYVPHIQTRGYQRQPVSGSSEPVIEVDGKMRFSLPGLPLFPSLGDDTILKPILSWTIQSAKAARFDAELSYVTAGMSWKADYNAVAPETGDTLDLVGWITIDNQSGKTFEKAKIKLMAGDVSKIQPEQPMHLGRMKAAAMAEDAAAGVTEKAFDEYHLYSLGRATTLFDQETKQVEFIHASGIPSKPVYVYDGAKMDMFRGWDPQSIRANQEYGTHSNPKVWVMREFYNSETNHLGMPLPKGRMRFYRSDTDGQMEFTGENEIDHTARNELVRLFTGNSFDLVGERKRTNYKQDQRGHSMDESFEIKLRNRKKTPVEIRVVEHLYRWTNWEITQKSDEFKKTDSQTVEFRVEVKPEEERTITYTVHYSW